MALSCRGCARVRAQAKTRAVKVLREAIGLKGVGLAQHLLRGHGGAMQPAERLQDFLLARTQPIDGDPKNKVPMLVLEAFASCSSKACLRTCLKASGYYACP